MERRHRARRRIDVRLQRRHVAWMAAGVLAGVGVISGLSGSGTTPPSPAPYLHDVTGRLQIGCGFDGAVSAPEICQDGHLVGVYIDDTTPAIGYWVNVAAARYPLVIVARAPNQTGCPYPQPPVICAQEFYPYESGYPVWEWGQMPRARAYILQDRFSLTGRPVLRWQANRLLRQARRRHPQLILEF